MSDRNPFVIPEVKPGPRRGCPMCGGMDYGGNMVYGVVTFTCRLCKNEWQGGIGVEPQDPRTPMPPQDPRGAPVVQFEKDSKKSDKPQDYVARRPDLTQDFRKGAPVPKPGDDDGR